MYQPQGTPYKHQLDYLQKSVHRRAFALFADMGTGKTKALLDEAGLLISEGLVNLVMVVSGKGNYMTWFPEIRRNIPRSMDPLILVWDGSDTQRWRMQLREFLAEKSRPRFFLANIEAVARSSRCKTVVRQILASSNKREVIVDESTLIKGQDTLQCEEMCRIGAVTEYRRIATGEPTPNGPLDLWGQFQFLGRDLLGYSSFYAFRARYCEMIDVPISGGAGRKQTRKQIIAYKNLDELHSRVAAHSFRVRKEDCLDLPPKVYQIREVGFTPEQERAYTEMRKFAMAEVQQAGGWERISSQARLGQISKMHQLLCGVAIGEDGKLVRVKNNRVDAMLDVCQESGRPTIIWCGYRANVVDCAAALRTKFGHDSVALYYGDTSDEERQLAIEEFQSGKRHFFVSNPDTGGRGITLTAAKTVVYYSNSRRLEHRLQSEDRCHRIGQTDSVNYVDLMIRGTLDERIIQALRKKIDVAAAISGDGYREWLV